MRDIIYIWSYMRSRLSISYKYNKQRNNQGKHGAEYEEKESSGSNEVSEVFGEWEKRQEIREDNWSEEEEGGRMRAGDGRVGEYE